MDPSLREKTQRERKLEEDKKKKEEAESAFEWWLSTKKEEDEKKRENSVNRKVSYLCSVVATHSLYDMVLHSHVLQSAFCVSGCCGQSLLFQRPISIRDE